MGNLQKQTVRQGRLAFLLEVHRKSMHFKSFCTPAPSELAVILSNLQYLLTLATRYRGSWEWNQKNNRDAVSNWGESGKLLILCGWVRTPPKTLQAPPLQLWRCDDSVVPDWNCVFPPLFLSIAQKGTFLKCCNIGGRGRTEDMRGFRQKKSAYFGLSNMTAAWCLTVSCTIPSCFLSK